MTIQEEIKLLEKETKKDRRWQSFWGSSEDLKWIHNRIAFLNALEMSFAAATAV